MEDDSSCVPLHVAVLGTESKVFYLFIFVIGNKFFKFETLIMETIVPLKC